MKAMFWHILIEIRTPAEKSAGGIVLSEGVKENDVLLCPVGQVQSVGPMAFKTKTPAGHDYSVHAEDIKEGTWVLINRKVGFPFKTRDGRYLQFVCDYEILTPLTEDEAASIKAYI